MTTATPQSVEKKEKRWFWDIESYDNLFLVGLLSNDERPVLEMHYLVGETDMDAERDVLYAVMDRCQEEGWHKRVYDLSKDATRLQHHFKQVIPSDGSGTLLSDFLGVKSEPVAPKEDVYIGFNTLHYDIPMIDHVLKQIVAGRLQTTPASLRKHSDTIINGTALPVNTLSYEQYANQVDAAHLDDSFLDRGRLTIGLKTLVGTLGGSIIESESNKSGHSDNPYDDTVYNINDIAELKRVVFEGTKLEGTYDIRRSLLNEYSDSLLPNNITVNCTSAKFVENIIAPEEPINDTPTLSFMYPAPHVAKEYGVEQFNVLEYTKDWYIKNVYQSVVKHNPSQAKYLLGKFLSVYNFYKSVEGKNWNDSARHTSMHNIEALSKEDRARLLEEFGTFLPLVDKFGNDSNTYVNFSLGGIHGAEVYKDQLEKDRAIIKELRENYTYISKIPGNAVTTKLKNIIIKQSRTAPDHLKDYPHRLLHEIPNLVKQTEESDLIIHEDEFSPFGMKTDKGKMSETLLQRYRYISSVNTIHQDFAGYYPMLLINMGVFYDGNGTDRYREVYNKRIAIKQLLSSLERGSLPWIHSDIIQNGYKLILNSASGILDGNFDTKCRANNYAMAMRITGQLFTFIIAQALALEGARVPSSNTDGIYVSDIEIELNKKIVDRELKKLLVTIDPEELFLVSKDTNNRLEIENGEVSSARGGTLTSHAGPQIDKKLSHPALCDAVLSKYLYNIGVTDTDLNEELLEKAYQETIDQYSPRKLLLMAGWLLRPTSGSLFVIDDTTPYKGTLRGFLTKEGSTLKRYNTRKQKPSIRFDEEADKLDDLDVMGTAEDVLKLKSLGVIDHWEDVITVAGYKAVGGYGLPNKERDSGSLTMLTNVKIAKLHPDDRLTFENRSLFDIPDEEIQTLCDNLDHEGYKAMIRSTIELWQNKLED